MSNAKQIIRNFVDTKGNKQSKKYLIALFLYYTLVMILDLSGLVNLTFVILAGVFAVVGTVFVVLNRSLDVINNKEKEIDIKISDYKNLVNEKDNSTIIIDEFEHDFKKRSKIFKQGIWNLGLAGLFLAMLISLVVTLPLNLYSILIFLILIIFLKEFLFSSLNNLEKINKMENVITEMQASANFVSLIEKEYKSFWF
ncbi:MAG: hypothetical protein QXF01_02660 [Candidatus Micrarchaeaceae archaeon]